MATLHRPRRRTSVWMSLIVVLLLSACGAPAATPAAPGSSIAPSAQPSSQPSPSPSAAPASATTDQPSPQPSPSTEPGTLATPPSVSLNYFWPAQLPNGFEIRPARSSADASGFSLDIGGVGGQHPAASIVGGKSSPAGEPPTGEGQRAEINVRNTTGMAYQSGAGYSVYWEESGTPYAIIGDLSLDQATAIANVLQPLDLAAWQKNLASAQSSANQPGPTEPDTHAPTVGAFYLFPEKLPEGFELIPARASADESSFSIDIARAGEQIPIASIVGGTGSPASERPTNAGQMAEVMVRTNKGMAYQRGAGYSVYWEESGTSYAIIGDLTIDEALAIADGLQSTDLSGWRSKLAEATAR